VINMKIQEILTLIDKVSASTLTSFEYKSDQFKIQMGKDQTVAVPLDEKSSAIVSNTTTDPAIDQTPPGKMIKSPLVGTFYAAPSEESDPFVSIGQSVKKGDVLGIIEAMKLMNELESDYTGTIAKVLVKNGDPVEYGQPLFELCQEV